VLPLKDIVLTCHIKADRVLAGMIFSEERWCCMPISCRLRVVLAQLNVERAKMSQPALSLRRLALESGVSLSVLAALNTGKSQRIDYATIDRLLMYFNRFFPVRIDDLLRWEAVPGERAFPSAASGLQFVPSGQG
jgi:DNA-binding Xre family transcriptional regulator